MPFHGCLTENAAHEINGPPGDTVSVSALLVSLQSRRYPNGKWRSASITDHIGHCSFL